MNNERTKKLILISLVLAIILIAVSFATGVFLKKDTDITKLPKDEVVQSAFVEITEKGFVPATLQVKKGTIVTFTNNDKSAHQPAVDPHPSHDSLAGFDSQTKLEKGQSYSFFFDKTGTWTYHDHLNPLTFQGTVIVK